MTDATVTSAAITPSYCTKEATTTTTSSCTDHDDDIVLPGSYKAGIHDSGVDHSQQKLRLAEGRLKNQLRSMPSVTTSISDSNITSDDNTSDSNYVEDVIIETLPCTEESSTWSYRCRCNFQIIRTPPAVAQQQQQQRQQQRQDEHQQDEEQQQQDSYYYSYAMREQGRPIEITSFPIATVKIQHAMRLFSNLVLNTHNSNSNKGSSNNNDNDNFNDVCMDFTAIKTNLTSCTFSSSWKGIVCVDGRDFDDKESVDCILTLNYDKPFTSSSQCQWQHEAHHVCRILKLRRLNGRSKGVLLSVGPSNDGEKNENKDNTKDGIRKNGISSTSSSAVDDTGTIRDVVYLIPPYPITYNTNIEESTTASTNMKPSWTVTLKSPTSQNESETTAISVLYEKPESAFYHPNASAMVDALTWMLNRLDAIQRYSNKMTNAKLNILEMYCGCGAHTVALGKSTLVDQILAVELDPRLVTACEHNVKLNGLKTVVKSKRGDAGTFAREWQRNRRHNMNNSMNKNHGEHDNFEKGTAETDTKHHEPTHCDYDVLLVDPPRQGLDEQVCNMAINVTTFHDFLYISCGHEALLRDLERLAPAWKVVQITQLDLFPRTDSIETLVHLRRRVAHCQNILLRL